MATFLLSAPLSLLGSALLSLLLPCTSAWLSLKRVASELQGSGARPFDPFEASFS